MTLQDRLNLWIDDRCHRVPGARAPLTALHSDWVAHCRLDDWPATNRHTFTRALRSMGYSAYVDSYHRGIEGLALRTTGGDQVAVLVAMRAECVA